MIMLPPWTRLWTVFVLMIIAISEFEAASSFQYDEDTNRKCGYDGCPKPKADMLNVHIVSHTHDDVGWLKTVDQYYYGSRSNMQKANVQSILDSVIAALLQDPDRRFIYVESAFFFKWWSHQTAELQEQVKQLVNEGRLEFIGGAWSMNDEAATHYHSTVDQFTWGLRRLNDTFGECGRPKIGWQIDPFGHSREFASMLTQMGYDGLFLGRIDFEDKAKRLQEKNAEMIWYASESLGKKANLFTGVLYNLYQPPPGFCFDILCSDEPIIDDKSSPEYNVDEKLESLFSFINNQANTTRTNNVILTFGGDFTHMDASYSLKNVDRLIKNINEREADGLKINAFHSTPSCYLKALHDSNIAWPTKSDDFFPYASDSHTYWTGYFTSRPALKRFERIANHYLQVCKQLSALAKEKTVKFGENLDTLREVMGVMQHHDAVTGTEKQHVANDYARLIQIGIEKCSANIKESLNQLSIESDNTERTNEDDDANDLKMSKGAKIKLDYENCADLNISSCQITENSSKFIITLYNPLAHSTYEYVRVPVPTGDYEVLDSNNASIMYEMVPIPIEVQQLPMRESDAVVELVFLADEIPPVGFKSYFVQRKFDTEEGKSKEPTVEDGNQGFTIGNKHLNLTFDKYGLLESAATRDVQMEIRQNFFSYHSFAGHNFHPEFRASGAYIFRPNGTEPFKIVSRADVRVIRGHLVDEVHQTFNEFLSQIVRINKRENYAEFEWLVGPIEQGNEIISRFDTDIVTNGIFYTDSNGREMMKRERDHRTTWNATLLEKIAGNYYPVTAKIAIEDETRRFSILTDRAQGGSSISDGSIELMVHRRLLRDDAFGVGEVLNETAFGKGLIVRGKYYLLFGQKLQNANRLTEATERFVQLKTSLPNWLFFSDANFLTYDAWKNNYKNIFSALSHSLPKNIHLLTFEPWKADSILIRFEHILAKDEDQLYSQAVTIKLRDVFQSFDVVSIRETTLAANQWIEDSKRLHFKSEEKSRNKISDDEQDQEPKVESQFSASSNERLSITLKPMEIRTFIVQLKSS